MSFRLLFIPAALVLFNFPNPAFADVLQDWAFSESKWTGTKINDASGKLTGETRISPSFINGVLAVNEDCQVEVRSISADDLPAKAMSVEAWVYLEEGRKWGSIVGYFQDNGAYERGWSLGYDETAFTFWISTGGKMILIKSDHPFQLNKWTHVLATFDGKKIRLFIGGRLVAEKEAKGKIAYPDKAIFTMGAYQDENEFYLMNGRLISSKLYDTALTGMEAKIAAGNRPEITASSALEFSNYPAVRFLKPGSALVTWTAGSKGRQEVVEFGKTKNLGGKAVGVIGKNGDREAVMTGLDPLSIYYYRIKGGDERHPRFSGFYELNTALNFTPPIVHGKSDDQDADQTAEIAKDLAGINKGFAVLLGPPDDKLALSLAEQSEFSVLGFSTDQTKIDTARRVLYAKKSYGARISFLHCESLAALPVTSGFADLVVCDKWPPNGSSQEIARILAHGRGVACLKNAPPEIAQQLSKAGLKVTTEKDGWLTARRPNAKDSGEWTHQYGDPGNTGTSGESLGGARSTSELGVQWFGRPGADFGLDRQSRLPAPLSVNGRLFHQGMNRLIALDSHNGSVLWGMESAHMQRLNMPRDASNWCADESNLYLAVRERAWVLDAETGKRKASLKVPAHKGDREWGYIGRTGNVLLGSTIKANSGYRKSWGWKMWFDGGANTYGTANICSDSLFAYSLDSHKPVWVYENGIILNTTIAASGDQLVFVESRNPVPKSSPTSRIASPELWKDQYLVALNSSTGKKLWEHPLDTEDGTVTFYLQFSPKAILISASNTQYHLYAYAPETGKPLWNHSEAWASDNHSGHIQHPVILNETIYLQPNGYDLTTGKIVTTNVGKKSGCHTYIGAKNALIYRGAGREVAMWDTESETVTSWPRLRPSCWLSFIPANGMLLVPEGGGGCSCGGWMETSIGFAPRKSQSRK